MRRGETDPARIHRQTSAWSLAAVAVSLVLLALGEWRVVAAVLPIVGLVWFKTWRDVRKADEDD